MDSKILAIKYIIYKVAQEYLKFREKDINDWTFFNENNNFNLDKCLLLPYLITIANGKKNELINDVFNDSFFPDIIAIDGFYRGKGVFVGEINQNNFNKYTQTDLGIEFNNLGVLQINPINYNFIDLDSVTKNNIDYSIQFIAEKRIKKFSILSSFELARVSMSNDAFDILKQRIKFGAIDNNDKAELVRIFQDKFIKVIPFYMALMEGEKNLAGY